MNNIFMSWKLLALAFIQVTREAIEDFTWKQKQKLEGEL